MAISRSSSQEEKNAHYRAALIEYARAMTARDAEAILRLFADDVVLADPVGSGAGCTSMAELRPYYTRVCTRNISARIEGHIACSKSNVACAPIRVDVEASSIHAIAVVQFNDQGLIARFDAHWGPGDVEGPDPSTGADYGKHAPYDDHFKPA